MTHVEPAANGLTQAQRATLTALADTLIPADEYPGAGAAGFLAFLDRNWGDLGTPVQARISAGALVLAQLAAGDAGAIAAGDAGGRMSADFRPGSAAAAQRPIAAVFSALPPPARDSLLSRLDQGDFDDDFPEPGGRWVALLFALVMQSYYADPANGGNRAACSWRMLGFDPAPKRPLPATSAARLQPSNASRLRAEYDAIVVGAGAGGGVVAALLAEAGFDVLLLERGAALTYAEVGRDHLRNHRYPMYATTRGQRWRAIRAFWQLTAAHRCCGHIRRAGQTMR